MSLQMFKLDWEKAEEPEIKLWTSVGSSKKQESSWTYISFCSIDHGLKLSIQKTKIMASGPITSWQIDGETVKTVANFIFLGSKITADFSFEIKIRLLLRGKVTTILDSFY